MRLSKIVPLFLLVAVVVGVAAYFLRSREVVSPLGEVEVVNTNKEQINDISDEDGIAKAMAEKYDRDKSEVNITVQETQDMYAKGIVSFEGEMGGGWFLAYNKGDNWEIVADGNGSVMCRLIAGYEFPTDMVPECWDEESQELVRF